MTYALYRGREASSMRYPWDESKYAISATYAVEGRACKVDVALGYNA